MFRTGFHILLLLLFSTAGFSQEIRLEHKVKADKSMNIRLDKQVIARTFDGNKLKGIATISANGKLVLEGKEISPDNIMMISGFVVRDSRDKAVGLGLSIGAGVVLPVALYYILGGIAWGMPNGIFVGATILVFDLMLAYAGTNLLGIYPRRFSTMNWDVVLPDSDSIVDPVSNTPVPLPFPSD